MQVLAQIGYEKIRQIGIGQGMNSEVFLAFDPQLQGSIAVKEISKKKFANDLEAYFREAQIMFAVSHPNIVRVQYACSTDEKICLAMPYFPNGSLSNRIQAAPLSLKQLLRSGQDVLAGLAKIHAAGFLHFDIKPSNVFYNNAGTAMVADFGQSRKLSAQGSVEVPPLYPYAIPPETFLAGIGTVQSDVFQAGLLLYRAANGDSFFDAQRNGLSDADLMMKIARGQFPNRNLFLPHVPKRLRTIIRKAMQINPEDRFSSAIEFSDVLGRVPIELNWTVEALPAGVMNWRAVRPDRPDLLVQLLPDGVAGWETKCFIVRGNSQRKRGCADIWRKRMTLNEANAHLKTVFEQMNA